MGSTVVMLSSFYTGTGAAVSIPNNYSSVMSNMSGVNVNPEVAKNRIFCSCCGGDLDVDEAVFVITFHCGLS